MTCLQHGVAMLGENFPEELAHTVLVLHDQDGLFTPHRDGRLDRSRLVTLDPREKYLHRGALSRLTRYPHDPPVLLDDPIYKRESEASAISRGLRGKEWLE